MADEIKGATRTDVLVVGAGPTGLTAAALLHRCGLAVRIIDKAPGAAKESRAFAVQARTLEVMLSLGIADAFLERGTIASGARVYLDGHPSAGFGFEFVERPDTPFPIILTLPQAETEAILVDHLAGQGIKVERGVTAERLVQDETGVTVEATAGGEALTLRASYLIGADGAHSFVRKALGLTFEGAPYAQTFLLADCSLEGELDEGSFSTFFHGSHFALWFPLKGRRFGRVITTSHKAVDDPSLAGQGSSPATLDEVEESFRAASQLDLRLVDPVWLSRYRVHHRGVNRYGNGRAFVAGDAAHIHSPAGGQGMNTGIQDAANLAWKLAVAIRARSPAGLVDSYDAERRPVGEMVLRATDRVFSLATSSSGWVAAARKVVLPLVGATLGRTGTLRSRAFNFLSELGIRYEAGFAVQDESGTAWAGGPAPGQRAPDAAIGHRLGIFDLIADYRFHLLAFRRSPLSEAAITESLAHLAELARTSGLDLETHLVAHSLVGRHPGLVQIENGAVLSAYGIMGPVEDALYLVRPDGHVAWRVPSFDVAACRSFIAERFSGP